jgi:hypothetical protein
VNKTTFLTLWAHQNAGLGQESTHPKTSTHQSKKYLQTL